MNLRSFSILISSFCLFQNLVSQVVFCPPGAEWHYEFSGTMWDPVTYNERIKYEKDTVEGLDTLKIISHARFYLFCPFSNTQTYLKEKGDTIFMRNKKTQNQWEILYNFAAQAGQGWTTSILTQNQSPTTFSFGVLSVTTSTLNGFSLKRLKVSNPGAAYGYDTPFITERIGSESFLFPYPNSNPGSCDAGGFISFLCYSDNEVGTIKFSSKACDPSLEVGLMNHSVNSKVKVYPNPSKDFIYVEGILNGDVLISDLSGRSLVKKVIEGNSVMDIQTLEEGVYLLSIMDEFQNISNTILVKE